ncbi:MAG: hypothetical protein AAF696_15095 [Bacteroidota bacterium]
MEKITYKKFEQLFLGKKAVLIHFHQEEDKGSLIIQEHLKRLERTMQDELEIIHTNLRDGLFIADYLGKGIYPGLHLIKDQACQRSFDVKPISFELLKFLIEEYTKEKEATYVS